MIKLSQRSTISPATLDSGFSPNFSNDRSNLWAVGFGITANDNNPYPLRLQEVEVKYVTNSKCRETQGPLIKEEMICAGEGGEGACKGDSGGPLWDAETNIVVGVTSWSNTCEFPNVPGEYIFQ